MRVLAVTNNYPTPQSPHSGAFVEQQIQSLRRMGLDVEVLFINREQQGIGAYIEVKKLVRSGATFYDPHIVHVMYGGVMADLVTRAIDDLPIVISLCGSDLFGRPRSGFVRRVMADYGVLASYKAARRATGIIVKSRTLRDVLPASIERDKIWIVPNGVDLDRFKPLDRASCRLKLGWNDDRSHVLFPSNASNALKRIELAMAAVDILNCSGIPVELHQLHGVSHSEVPIWLNAADVITLTSIHEGSPNIIKEALACNRPVVSVDVGDVRERVAGIEGCYLARAEPGDLAAKIRLVLDGPRQVEGRARIRELSLEKIAQQLSDIYIAVLSRSRMAAGQSIA